MTARPAGRVRPPRRMTSSTSESSPGRAGGSSGCPSLLPTDPPPARAPAALPGGMAARLPILAPRGHWAAFSPWEFTGPAAGSLTSVLRPPHCHVGNAAPKSKRIYSGIKTPHSARSNYVEIRVTFSSSTVSAQRLHYYSPAEQLARRAKHMALIA